MEQNEKAQAEEKEDLKLGRIQYKLDYDFQQGQVCALLIALLTFLRLRHSIRKSVGSNAMNCL